MSERTLVILLIIVLVGLFLYYGYDQLKAMFLSGSLSTAPSIGGGGTTRGAGTSGGF